MGRCCLQHLGGVGRPGGYRVNQARLQWRPRQPARRHHGAQPPRPFHAGHCPAPAMPPDAARPLRDSTHAHDAGGIALPSPAHRQRCRDPVFQRQCDTPGGPPLLTRSPQAAARLRSNVLLEQCRAEQAGGAPARQHRPSPKPVTGISVVAIGAGATPVPAGWTWLQFLMVASSSRSGPRNEPCNAPAARPLPHLGSGGWRAGTVEETRRAPHNGAERP